MVSETNSINAATTGIVGNTGTAFTATAATQYNVIVGGSTSSTLSNVAPSATSGVPLISGGASANPSFGTAVVAGGGTGIATTTVYGLIAGGTTATGPFQTVTPGASGTLVQSGGTGALHSYTATPSVTSITIGGGSSLGAFVDKTSWTPALTFGGGSTGITYSTQAGYYTKIGNTVFIWVTLILTSKGSSTGVAAISIPFTAAAAMPVNTMSCIMVNVTAVTTPIFTVFVGSTATTGVYYETYTGAGTQLADTNFQNGSQIYYQGAFFV